MSCQTNFFIKVCVLLILLTSFTNYALLAQEEYISAKSFAENNGIAYQWFPIQKKLIMRKELKTIHFSVGSPVALVDGVETNISSAPEIQNGQIMVPASAVNVFFKTNTNNKAAPLQTQTQAITPKQNYPIPTSPMPPPVAPPAAPPVAQPVAPPTIVQATHSSSAVLVALRHSSREDHTRVVLEFSDSVTYKTDSSKGSYRLIISGCQNLVPTNRTNPVGRAISEMLINSGPDRTGLILTFILRDTKLEPSIETVANPFRMILSFPYAEQLPVATTTQVIASATVTEKPDASKELSKPVEQNIPVETAPEINIEVPLAELSNQDFRGRIVVIDPGHGGSDRGAIFQGRPDEKTINLEIAKHLQNALHKQGLKTVLTRSSDITMSSAQRVSFANRYGGDLFVSIHVGSSSDSNKAGIACYSYSKTGIYADEKAQGLNNDAIYIEWQKTARLDLGSFLAQKINKRMLQHLNTENRGAIDLPLAPLRFIVNPAVMVETGMLSDKTEGKNLISDNYKKAVAQSIANGIVDFFNGISVNQ